MEKPKPHWDSGPEMLKDILINRRIRASNPKKFNDPWDCKPCIDPVLLEDHQTRRAMAESLIATQKGGPKGDITDYRLLTDPEFLKKNVSRFNDFMEGFIPSRWGMICLSTAACSTLMWSHYSDHHRGLCLEFTVKDTVFRGAVKISYRTVYPKMVLGGKFAYQMLTVKAKEWEKEEEYRLVCPLSVEVTDAKESPFVMKDGFLPIGATSLHAIIMGCQMGEDEEQEIRQLVKKHAPYVRLKRAVRVPHNYLLTLEDVTNADAPQDSAKAQNTTQARQEAPEDTRQI
jgi:hypothetical protein